MTNFSISIQFPVSRSKSYRDVIKNAKLFSDFSQNPNILKITDIGEIFGRWDNFSFVIFNTTKWAGTNVFFCDKPLLPYKNEFFYKLLDLKHCFKEYTNSFDKIGFCTESDWGCKRLKNLTRYFGSYAFFLTNPWYKYGRFIDENTWLIDKNKIYEVLTEEVSMKIVDSCPAFKVERIMDCINKLPNQIKIDENWAIEYKTDFLEKGRIQIPSGIRHVTKEQNTQTDTGGRLIVRIGNKESEDDKLEDEDIDGLLDKLLEQRKNNPDGK